MNIKLITKLIILSLILHHNSSAQELEFHSDYDQSFKLSFKGELIDEVKLGEDISVYFGIDGTDNYGESLMLSELPDINKNGFKDLIIRERSGGAHCCYFIKIYEIRDHAIEVIFKGGEKDFGPYELKDINNDGSFEIYFLDDTFNYWNTSYVWSPSFYVYLEWNGHAYEYTNPRSYIEKEEYVSIEQERILLSEFIKNLKYYALQFSKLKHWKYNEESNMSMLSEYWSTILILLEDGKPKLAQKFSNLAWGSNGESYEEFMNEFKLQLHSSPHIKYFDAVGGLGWFEFEK